MRKYYAVYTRICPNGEEYRAPSGTWKSREKPERYCYGEGDCVIAMEWFDSYEEAEKFILEVMDGVMHALAN